MVFKTFILFYEIHGETELKWKELLVLFSNTWTTRNEQNRDKKMKQMPHNLDYCWNCKSILENFHYSSGLWYTYYIKTWNTLGLKKYYSLVLVWKIFFCPQPYSGDILNFSPVSSVPWWIHLYTWITLIHNWDSLPSLHN